MSALDSIYRACSIELRSSFLIFIKTNIAKLQCEKILLIVKWERLSIKNSSIDEAITILCVDDLKEEQITVNYNLEKNISVEVNIIYAKSQYINYLNMEHQTIPISPTDGSIVSAWLSNEQLSAIPFTYKGLEQLFTSSKYLSILTEILIKYGSSIDGCITVIKTLLTQKAYTRKLDSFNNVFLKEKTSVTIAKYIREYKIKICSLDTSVKDYIDENGTTFLFPFSSTLSFSYITIPQRRGFNNIIQKQYMIEPHAVIGKEKNNYFILTKTSKYEFLGSPDDQLWTRLNIEKMNKFILSKEIISSQEFTISFLSQNLAEILQPRAKINVDRMFSPPPIPFIENKKDIPTMTVSGITQNE